MQRSDSHGVASANTGASASSNVGSEAQVGDDGGSKAGHIRSEAKGDKRPQVQSDHERPAGLPIREVPPQK